MLVAQEGGREVSSSACICVDAQMRRWIDRYIQGVF